MGPDASLTQLRVRRRHPDALQLAPHAPLHRVDQIGPQAGRRDDAVDRADPQCPLDAVDAVELVGDLAELLAADLQRELAQARAQRLPLGGAAWASSAPSARTRGSAAVRASTSRANTTAAAGAPPITDANEPSSAATSRFSFRCLEKTTNAPPW